MLEEAIGLSRQIGNRVSLALTLEALAMMAANSAGEAERSAILLGAAEGLLRVDGRWVSSMPSHTRSRKVALPNRRIDPVLYSPEECVEGVFCELR